MTREEAEGVAAKLVTVTGWSDRISFGVSVAGLDVDGMSDEQESAKVAAEWRAAIVRTLVGE